MAQALGRLGLVHRDLRPENLLFADDGGLRLVDFQFAVCHKSYKEDSIYRKHPELIRPLGTPEYSRFNYTWDDMYSAAKVIERLGNGPVASKAHQTALDGVGRLKVCFPRKYLRRFALKKFLIKFVPVASVRRRLRERLRGGE
jgi:serine/threonine protein kinase